MKKSLFLLLLATNIAFGQSNKNAQGLSLPAPDFLDKSYQLPGPKLFSTSPDTSGKEKLMNAFIEAYSNKKILHGKLSHTTSDGSSVYRIEPDNMACLVPDMNKIEDMPALKKLRLLGQTDNMPNAGPEIRLMPKAKSK